MIQPQPPATSEPTPNPAVSRHQGYRLQHVKPITDTLYVVVAIENPELYRTRFDLYRAFEKHVADSGAILYTVELAHGDRCFEVTDPGNPRHIQLRGKSIIWRKENLQNIGVAHLPHDWKYVYLADADFHNTRPDWVQATLQALQRYSAVQGFSTYACLRPDHTVESINDGFAYAWTKAKRRVSTDGVRGATGGEWAYRREAWDLLEGMLETPILGSADWYMTYALAGAHDRNRSVEMYKCAPRYIDSVEEWCHRAATINRSIGYVQNHAIHYWHGPYNKRGYDWRWKILTTHAFDPYLDLKRSHTGVLELRGNKPVMGEEIEDYFGSRCEDALS